MKLTDYHTIILASKSPRRLDILHAHGLEPVVLPTDTDEVLPEGIGMEDAVILLSGSKAAASAADPATLSVLRQQGALPALVIAADTIVFKEEIMGKPEDRRDAFRMLDAIRGTFHRVATGVTLLHYAAGADLHAPVTRSFCDVTTVWCKDYTDEEIYAYIDAEPPYDKAGSYAIQSSFAGHIDHIEGDYENVVGLPFYRIGPACDEF
ncbi:MAG: Maf family protein [Mogibacterium sp.]|nr:Maf family protein [Mogibacterium sp.]